MTHQMSHAEVYLIIAVFVLVMLLKAGAKIIKFVTESFILMLLIRHFTGAHYHGERRTDATWWQHGSTTSRKYGHDTWISRWEHKPQGHRALWRTGCTLAFFGIVYGVFAARAVTLHAAEALIVYGLIAAGFVIESKIRLRVHNRHVLNPIVKSLAPVLRLSVHAVRRMVHIAPENIKDEGEVGYIELPDEITPSAEMQSTVNRIVDAHLPVDTEIDWQMQQAPRIGVILAGLRPPVEVPWDDLVAEMEKCPVGDVVIGLDRHKKPYGATFTGLDDPHWGFGVQTGSGKSNFLGVVVAQILHQDPLATASVIDPKRVSLIDFLGSPYQGTGLKPLIPGVKMANNPVRPQDMRDLIHDTYELMDSRALRAERDRTLKFPIHLLVIDELPMFTDIQKEYWDRERADNRAARLSDKTIPELGKDDPMWGEIRALLRMGRFTNIHLVVVAQDLRDDSFGGKGARNYLGFRGLGNYNKKQYDMLVGTSPYPLPQKGIGRWLFINADEQTWVQVTRGDHEKVYAWASHGRADYQPEVIEQPSVQHAEHAALSPSIVERQTDGQPAGQDVIVGIDAASQYLDMTDYAFAKARQRTESNGKKNRIPGEFKVGRQLAWYASDLDEWKRNRPGSKEAHDG